jgi:hypothetical protein
MARVAVAALAFAVVAAATAATAPLQHRAELVRLYAKDHPGRPPAADGDLQPYAGPYGKLLARCTLAASDLTGAATSLAGQVAAAGGKPFTTLSMLQALARHVTWSRPRSCWDTFFAVEATLRHQAAAADLRYPRQSEALYVYDHLGANPPGPQALTPYSNALETIVGACTFGIDDTTNLMIHLSDMASEQGGRIVTTLQMLQAVVRRIDWKGRRLCYSTFDDAEGHMEAGGP